MLSVSFPSVSSLLPTILILNSHHWYHEFSSCWGQLWPSNLTQETINELSFAPLCFSFSFFMQQRNGSLLPLEREAKASPSLPLSWPLWNIFTFHLLVSFIYLVVHIHLLLYIYFWKWLRNRILISPRSLKVPL